MLITLTCETESNAITLQQNTSNEPPAAETPCPAQSLSIHPAP